MTASSTLIDKFIHCKPMTDNELLAVLPILINDPDKGFIGDNIEELPQFEAGMDSHDILGYHFNVVLHPAYPIVRECDYFHVHGNVRLHEKVQTNYESAELDHIYQLKDATHG